MEIKNIWAVYFSATGTTKKVVTTLASSLCHSLGLDTWQMVDLSQSLRAEHKQFDLPFAQRQELTFGPEDLVVLGVPVYAGRVPNLLLPCLQSVVHGNGALAVPVVLYGNRNFDDGLMELRNLLRDNGFHPVSAAAIVGEHSFSTVLGAGRPDEEDMALVQKLADQTADKVKALTEAPADAVAVEGCDPIRPYYTPRDRHGEPIRDFLKAKPVTNTDKCSQCGLCASLCPMGSIDPSNVSKVAGKCIKCCACVKGCPTGAKYFDHSGYLYHQHELEEQYAGRRGESKIFL